MPEVGGVFLQGESEIAVGNMLFGAAGCGARVFTTSSSLGISLMSEAISYISSAQYPVVFVNIANDLGSMKVANIVALGAFGARSKIVDFEVLRKCVQEKFSSKEKLIPINMAALEEGKKAAR